MAYSLQAKYYEEVLNDAKIKIFNLHQEGDIFTNFVCEVMPFAKSFCHALSSGKGAEPAIMNPTRSFEHDRLAIALYKTEGFSTSLKRDQIRYLFKEALPNFASKPDLKLLCPSNDDLKELLRLSLAHEKSLFLKYVSLPQDEKLRSEYLKKLQASHVESFNLYIKDNKFCNWDVDYAVRHDEEVQNWIKSLEKKNFVKMGKKWKSMK
uniref:Uncharacterized protein n=1 Tax=Corethron hystrix TaxID=216773 RepID=A0A7S1BIJ9_9STRA|mmetsp:Transcript_29873/g.68536  ORF Transcript_29873/g.68536 Transcript_29873/m.68536 type:complete len:208 (+) Transcript_29873:1110-1733(+)